MKKINLIKMLNSQNNGGENIKDILKEHGFFSYDSILSELSTSNQKDKEDKKEIYTNLSRLVAKIQNDYSKYYNEKVSDEEIEEEGGYYEEYIFYPNIKIEITDGDDGVFLEINGEEINENPLKYIENLDIELLAKYIIKYELKYLSQFEYERMSTSGKEISSRILKRDFIDSKNKKDIELLGFDYDRISSSGQKILDIILKYVEYIKFENLELDKEKLEKIVNKVNNRIKGRAKYHYIIVTNQNNQMIISFKTDDFDVFIDNMNDIDDDIKIDNDDKLKIDIQKLIKVIDKLPQNEKQDFIEKINNIDNKYEINLN